MAKGHLPTVKYLFRLIRSQVFLWALRSPEICHGLSWLRAKAAIEDIGLHYDLNSFAADIVTSAVPRPSVR